MQIFRGINSVPDLEDATIVTVGSFDGVHSGHATLLETLRKRAASESLRSVVVSFSPHPRVTLGRAEGLQLLSSDAEKAKLLADEGIDSLLLIEFDAQFSALSYEEFIEEYLIKRLNMKELVVGFNHHMGHNGGSAENILHCAQRHNFKLSVASEHNLEGEKISSTAIRHHIENGNIELANALLGHQYLIIGQSDSNGKVSCNEPLKLIPAAAQYSATVNGMPQKVEVNKHREILCDTKDKEVTIKLLSRYEK